MNLWKNIFFVLVIKLSCFFCVAGVGQVADYSCCRQDSIAADGFINEAVDFLIENSAEDSCKMMVDLAINIYYSHCDYEMVSYCYTVLAMLEYRQNNIYESFVNSEKALNYIEQVKGDYFLDYLVALNNLAVLEMELENYSSALSRLRTIRFDTQFDSLYVDAQISTLRNLAMIEAKLGDVQMAELYFNQLLERNASEYDLTILALYLHREFGKSVVYDRNWAQICASKVFDENCSLEMLNSGMDVALVENDSLGFYEIQNYVRSQELNEYWTQLMYSSLLRGAIKFQNLLSDYEIIKIKQIVEKSDNYSDKYLNKLSVLYYHYRAIHEDVETSYENFEKWWSIYAFGSLDREFDLDIACLILEFMEHVFLHCQDCSVSALLAIYESVVNKTVKVHMVERYLLLPQGYSTRFHDLLLKASFGLVGRSELSSCNKLAVLALAKNISLTLKYNVFMDRVREWDLDSQNVYYQKRAAYNAAVSSYYFGERRDSLGSDSNMMNILKCKTEFRILEDSIMADQKITSIDIDKLEKSLCSRSGVIHYFIGDSIAYAIGRLGSEEQWINWADVELLTKHVDLVTYSCLDHDGNSSEGLFNSELYNLLFPPNINWSEVEHLTIVPDGILHKLSFESLVVGFHEDGRPKYLIEEVPISYSLGIHLSREFEEKTKERVVAFAPSFDDEHMSASRDCSEEVFGSLYCNEEEVKMVNEYMGGVSFTAQEATVGNFKATIEENDIFHLSTHACIDTSNYYNSAIVFNDGQVTIADLYETDWYNKTVILSACNTAGGKLVSGEGVFNFARTLTELGCKEVIVSLWPIDDCSTKDFIGKFYEHKSDGLSSAKALQQARIDYLNEADKLHAQPYFWAPLILISNDINVGVGQSWVAQNGLMILSIVGFLVIAFSFYLFYRRIRGSTL